MWTTRMKRETPGSFIAYDDLDSNNHTATINQTNTGTEGGDQLKMSASLTMDM